MRVRQLARTLAVAGLTTLLLAACGGGGTSGTASYAGGGSSAASSSSAPTTPAGNGEAAKTGQQVADDAATALASAPAVHLVGSGTSDGQPLGLDLHLQGADATGTITMAGQPLAVISTGGQMYAKAPASFWKSQQVPAAAAKKLDGQWVKLPADAASSFGDLSLTKLAADLRKPTSATWQPQVQKSTYEGRDVVVITQSDGSTTTVAGTGTPYPLRSEDKGKDPGTVTLSDFGTPVAIAAPPSAIDLSTFGG